MPLLHGALHLNFTSHHPEHHKLGVARTLLNTCEKITTEEEDRTTEKDHLKKVEFVKAFSPI